ncbi:MAG: PCRF domain-containing protein, partial [Syntrophomonadaceae bacterium]|nr:PCRF domain-containing protein [Syntrophomonadaceae bacterium]
MLEKLQSLEDKYNELTELLSTPEVINDQSRFQKYAKAHADLNDIVAAYIEYKKVLQQTQDIRQMLEENDDEEFRQMLVEEAEELRVKKEDLEQQLKILLLPK